jgi:hemoglobin-like flavoprotein
VNPEQITLIRSTWARVVASNEPVARLFYARLFSIDPSLRSQFRADIDSQGKKLVDMMQAIVNSLDQQDRMLSAARELGRRHHFYGVREEDYDSVREAMMWLFEQTLGERYTPDADRAWRKLYDMLAAAMIEGAHGEGKSPR